MEYFSRVRVTPNETVAHRIKGSSSSYPPVISAIRKIAVIGACMTPAISPAIPTITKFDSGRLAPQRLALRATMKPRIAPSKSVGPKVPPTPPPEFVSVILTTFSSSTATRNTGTPQGDLRRKSRGLGSLPSSSSPPLSSCITESYPSPKRGGKKKISRQRPEAQTAQRIQGLRRCFLMESSSRRVKRVKYCDTSSQKTPSSR